MSNLANLSSKLSSEPIVIKPRDLVLVGCVAGIGLGLGAFGLFHYAFYGGNEGGSKYPSRSRPEQVTTRPFIYTDDEEHDHEDGDGGLGAVSPRYHMAALHEMGSPMMSHTLPTLASRQHSQVPTLSHRFSLGYTDPTLFKAIEELPQQEQLKRLKEHNTKLSNLLQITENLHYNPSSIDHLTPTDIETLRAIFDSIDKDDDGCISGINELVELYSALGEPLTNREAQKLLTNKKLIPDNSGQVAFSNFLPFWQMTHRGSKKNKYYSSKFKFIYAKLKGSFDINKVVLAAVGSKATTEYRINFYYKMKSGQSQRISPWHDIPLHHLSLGKQGNKSKVFNFICEVPKWTRAKYEIATGESYNPIHQDVKNGKLRYYKHGDMMFNYGALPQTWEDPNHTPEETGCPGDNDPLDCIEIGTRQLGTGSVTPVKILGVLALLDSGETDWKLLAININDQLATKLNDVHDIEEVMPGAIKAIREYLRIYKVCTGSAANTYAFRGEALNQEFAIGVIEETHEMWKKKLGDNFNAETGDDPDTRPSVKGTILTV